MHCHEVQESLSDYLDERLDPRATEALEAHLTGCTACRTALAEMRRLDAILQGFADPPLDEERLEGLWARVEARLSEAPDPPTLAEAAYLNEAPLVLPTPAQGPAWLVPVLAVGGVLTVAVVVLAVSLAIQRGRGEAGGEQLVRRDLSGGATPGAADELRPGMDMGADRVADMASEPSTDMAPDLAADTMAADRHISPGPDMAAASGDGAPGRRRPVTAAGGGHSPGTTPPHGRRPAVPAGARPRPDPAPMPTMTASAMPADSSLQALLQQAAGPMGGGGGGAGGGEGLPARLGPGHIRAGVDGVIASARACYTRYRVPGTCNVRVVIQGSTGRPVSVAVQGDLAGTPTGRCVEGAFGRARFQRFSSPSQSFVFPLVFR